MASIDNNLRTILHWLIVVLLVSCSGISAYDKEITVNVDAGRTECFYHTVQTGETIDLDYQVIDGGHGDLDISFTLYAPNNLVIVSDFKKPENVHRHQVKYDGDYRFCFDNSFSTFNRKTVFFELVIERENQPNLGDNQWNDALDGLTPEEYYSMKVEEIMDYIGRIRMQMTKARQLQDIQRSHEARDRNLAETNYMKVNAWSFFQICAMCIVGLLQVYLVRSIFDTNTRMSKFWQKVGM